MTIVIPDPEELDRPVPTSMQAASLLKAIHEQLHAQFDTTNLYHAEDLEAAGAQYEMLTDIFYKLEACRVLLAAIALSQS